MFYVITGGIFSWAHITPFYISMDWEIKAISLGCVPFGGSHTALKTLDLIKEVTFFSFFFFPIYIYINVTFSNKF